MKKIILITVAALCISGLNAQELDKLISILNRQTNNKYSESFVNNQNDLALNYIHYSTQDNFNTNSDKLYAEKESNDFHSYSQRDDDENRSYSGRFKGHWAGIEIGINQFLNSEHMLSRDTDAEYLELKTWRSCVFNINFAQYSFGFPNSTFGLVTGMGLEFNNYFFANENTIMDIDRYTTAVDISDLDLIKTKLATAFIRVPLLLEFQVPRVTRSNRAFISAGVIGGLYVSSHTKFVHELDGTKKKEKNKDDFNITPFRYGFTLRIGYNNSNMFFDYYITPMFIAERAPELYPFSAGISFSF